MSVLPILRETPGVSALCYRIAGSLRFGRYPSKIEVATINDRRLQALDSPLQAFLAWDEAGVDSKGFQVKKEDATQKLNVNTLWPAELSLKVGAMVMLITVCPCQLSDSKGSSDVARRICKTEHWSTGRPVSRPSSGPVHPREDWYA